ncbi:hypothetical protein B0H19DRAFT_1069515 [Mycena capillaripes]|nr:hypothetical protein B0H19DRAFT_1069515 [Mycena capillaripes]
MYAERVGGRQRRMAHADEGERRGDRKKERAEKTGKKSAELRSRTQYILALSSSDRAKLRFLIRRRVTRQGRPPPSRRRRTPRQRLRCHHDAPPLGGAAPAAAANRLHSWTTPFRAPAHRRPYSQIRAHLRLTPSSVGRCASSPVARAARSRSRSPDSKWARARLSPCHSSLHMG